MSRQKKPTKRLELAQKLVPDLENWLRQCKFWTGDVKATTGFTNSAVGFEVQIGTTASAITQAQGLPERWGDFPVRYWNNDYPDGVKGVDPHGLPTKD